MPVLFWDASALAKRYALEVGSETVDALFAAAPSPTMATTAWGYAETYSILLRRLNSGALDQATFTMATSALQAEVIDSADFLIFPVSDIIVLGSIGLMRTHNLDATDAALLRALLDVSQRPGAPACVMVSSDNRLLRAASAEGLLTLNPQLLSDTDVADWLARIF